MFRLVTRFIKLKFTIASFSLCMHDIQLSGLLIILINKLISELAKQQPMNCTYTCVSLYGDSVHPMTNISSHNMNL